MTLYKFGESVQLADTDIEATEKVLLDPEIEDRLKAYASGLKRIAPKGDDFLYFSAVMMHAAEASTVNPDGTVKNGSNGQPVVAGFAPQGESLRWVTNDPSVRPYKNCFPAGTAILLEDGSVKNIEDIVVGDIVITHNNRPRQVLRTFITPHNGNLIELSVRNGLSILTTDNHPFYKLEASVESGSKDSVKHLLRRKNVKTKKKFVNAGDIQKYDALLAPVLSDVRYHDLDADSARLLGIFAAEGSFAKKYGKNQGVRFTFNLNELNNLAVQTKELINKVFPKASVRISSGKSTCELSATGKNVAAWFKAHVGEYSDKKSVGRSVFYGTDDVKQNFILGWLEGDGHVTKTSGQVIGVTVSRNLAYQIKMMLNALNIYSSIRFVQSDRQPKKINPNYDSFISKDNYRIEIPATAASGLIKNSSKLKFVNRGADKHQKLTHDGHVIHSVTNTKFVPFNGNVYNFEVEEDNSYVANGLVVHNCNGDIFPEAELLKAYKKWVGCPLCIDHKSGSVDHIRGVIVDTYYDRKAKRVIALCALDKVSFPDLARKVSTGYATCVSMGTAVGRAICTDCGRVARTEADFCPHMISKSCYGEINLDLKPLELSIVVNGADPQAKIRHILASARNLNTEADRGLNDLKSLTGATNEKVNEIKQQIVTHIKEGLDSLIREFEGQSRGSDEANVQDTSNFSNSGSSIVDAEQVPLDQDPAALNNPYSLRVASANFDNKDAFSTQFLSLKRDIEQKLAKIEQDFQKLSNLGDGSRETKMEKKSYFQGGGNGEGADNMPAKPGEGIHYPVDPQNDKLRTHGDKQMEGQMDLGPVDGMPPGYDSYGRESDEARKKRLQRLGPVNAAQEERSARRKEAVARVKEALEKRRAYFQGGGGVNEPSPGKPKYTSDPLNEKDRVKEDKQMQGQPPFPGVGSVDGLHPSPSSAETKDELKRKELLQRADLKATFVKAAKPTGEVDLAASQWQIFADGKLIFSATVDELTNGRSDVLGDQVATKEFGRAMLKRVKAEGFEKAIALYKKAQMPPAAPAGGGAEAAPAGAAGPAPAPTADLGGGAAPMGDLDTANKGGDGETKPEDMVEQLDEAIQSLDDVKEELKKTVPVMEAEKPEAPAEGMPAATATLSRMSRDIHKVLLASLKKTADLVDNQIGELYLVKDLYDSNGVSDENRSYIETLSNDTIADANRVLVEAVEALDGFIRYARGTESMEAIAALESRGHEEANETEEQILSELQELVKLEEANTGEHAMAAASDSNDIMVEMKKEDAAKQLNTLPDTAKVKVEANSTFDLTTREGRTAYRAKLAAETIKWNPILNDFHKHVDSTTHLDVKPSGDLGDIETIEQTFDKMMDVAEAPPKVRKDAEEILKMVKAGAITVEEVPNLVAHGADPAAVAYFMQMWKPVDGGTEFAKGLVKEHAKAAADKELADYKVKVARAYQMAYQMVDKGMITAEPTVIASQVEEILGYNDQSFDSLKRIIAMTPSQGMTKQASRVPNIGMIGSGDPLANQVPVGDSDDLFTSLSKAFAGRKY